MATKEQKNQKIQEIKDSFAKAQVAIVSDPTGLTVAEITDLRRRLQKEGVISETLMWEKGTYKATHVRSLIIKYAAQLCD